MTSFVGQDGRGNHVDLVTEDGMAYPTGVVWHMRCGGLRQQLENVRDLSIRDDDVIIVAFVKSGTHWLWEIVSMVINNRSDYDKNSKEKSMLDIKSKQHMEDIPSPRVMNSHFPVRWLPTQLLEKRRPILHIMRNPKDVFVSYFNHYNTLPNYNHVDSFTNFLPMMLGETGVYLKYPWFKYELEWEEFTKKNPEYPILNLYYEDIKKDPTKSITDIARFLQCDISQEMIADIAAKTSIEQMRQADAAKPNSSHHNLKVQGNPVMYRKGMVGDWKNWFTVAENERVDTWLEENLVNTDLTFQYT